MALPDGTWKLTSGRDLFSQTTLRTDIVLWSKTGKKLIIIELTVPWEPRCEEAYERKKAKYTELVDLCRQWGWCTWLFPVEVGVRGLCSQSICRLMTAVATTGRKKRKAVQKLSQAAERASSWLWLRHRGEELEAPTNTQWLITTVGPSDMRVFMD